MPKSELIAKIKRMDVTNKIKRNHWRQMIGITLGEIALNDHNLLAIRKFRPNEEVLVTITPLQQDMIDKMQRIKKEHPVEGILSGEELSGLPEDPLELMTIEDEEELMQVTVITDGEDDSLAEGEEVAKNFEF